MAIKLKSVPPELEAYLSGYRKSYGHQKNWPEMANTLMTDWIEKNKRQDILLEPMAQPNATAETIKALPKAFKAGSLAAGLAGVKAYQAIGGPKDIGVDINKQIAYAPEVIGRAVGGLKRDIGQAFGKQQPSSRYDPKSPRMRELEDIEKQQAEKAVQRFNSTKDIVDFYDKEIEGIKSKYKENLITKTAESLPLSLSGLVATMANPALGAAYTGYVFGGSSFQDLLDKAFAEERKKPENKALDDAKLRARVNDAYKMYAAVSGAIQAGGEYAGNILLSKFIPGANPIKNRIIKGITTALGGGVEEAVTETGQEAGSILAEKAAGLDTSGAGARLWDSFSVGGLSGLFLGGLGGAAFRGDTIADVKQAVNNPTPETKAKAGESIYNEWKAKSPAEKQMLLNKMTPEARKIFTEGISQAETKAKQAQAKATEAEAKAGELAAENVQVKAELQQATIHPQAGLKTVQPVNPANAKKGSLAVIDASNLGLVNTTVSGEGAKVLEERFGSLGHAAGDAYLREVGEAVKKATAGTDIEAWLGQRSDEVKLYSPTLSPAELNEYINKIQSQMKPVQDFAGIDKDNKRVKGQVGLFRTAGAQDVAEGWDAAMEKAGKIEKRKAEPLQSTDFKQTQAQVMEKVKADLAMTDDEIVDLITNEAKDGAMLRTLVEGGVAQGKDIDGIAKDMGRYVKAIKNAAGPETQPELQPETPTPLQNATGAFTLPKEVIAKAKAYDLMNKNKAIIKDVTPDGYGPTEETGTAKVNDMLKGESIDEAMTRKIGYQIDNGNVKIEETKDGWKAIISTSTGPNVIRATKKQAVINLAFKKLYPSETFKPTPAPVSRETPVQATEGKTRQINDFQERLMAAQDLAKEAREQKYRITPNGDGSVTIYHGTSASNYDKIIKSNTIERQSYFSPNKRGSEYYSAGKNKDGKTLDIKVDARDIEYSTGTGEIYAPDGLVKDIDNIWKAPKRITTPAPLQNAKPEATPVKVAKVDKPDLRPAKVVKPTAKDMEMFEGLVEGNRNAGVQPGGLIRDDNNRVINRYGPTSTYSPEWRAMFGREGSVKGVGKDEVIRILDKLKAGTPLTERQQTAYEQIIETLKDFETRAPEIAIADDLNPGDAFMKDGEKHTVKEITEDGKVKIQNGTTEYLNPGETIEIDRGTLEKKGETVTEKTPAGDQAVIDGMAGREMPRGPIKQTPSVKSDRGTIFDQEGLKTDREIQGERGQEEIFEKQDFAKFMDEIKQPVENWQDVQDALRYATPEQAQEILAERGIEISLDELKKAEPMIKGGAGVKREYQHALSKGIESVVGNMDERIQELSERPANATLQAQLKAKFTQWETSDKREADDNIQELLKWAGVQSLPKYIDKATSEGIDLTLHHNEMAKLIDNTSPADLMAVERMMGKDSYTFAAAGQRLYTEAATSAKTLTTIMELHANTTDPVELVKLEKAGTALLNNMVDYYGFYRNAMTNGGRLIEYARQNKKAEAYADLNTFTEMLRSGDLAGYTEETILDAFRKIKRSKALTPETMVNAVQPSLMDKINEWQKAIKLTNPKTHIVNFVSNVANGFYNANAEKMLSVMVDAGATMAGKERTTFAGEIGAGWKAGLIARNNATAKMLEAMKNDLPNQRAWETQYNTREAIKGKLGKVVRTPFRLLNASDQYFYTINYNVALGQELYADLYKQGLRGDNLWGKWEIDMNAPADRHIKIADAKAQEWLYREKLDPANAAIQKVLKEAPVLQFFLPFFKTPVNLAKWAYRRTPVLGLPGKNMADIRAGGREARVAITRQIAGAAIYGSVAALWAAGKITGPAPEDEDKRAEFYRQGKVPYGIQIGDRYYSYARWEPLTTITKVLTTILEASKQYTKDKSRGLLSAGGRAAGQIANSLMDQNYMLGLSNMFEAINDPVRNGQRFISSLLLGSTIPTGVGYVATLVDENIRSPKGLVEQAKARIPGLSKMVEPKLGVLGEPLKREGLFSRVQPIIVSKKNERNIAGWEGFGLTARQIDKIETEISNTDKPIPYPTKYYKDKNDANKRYTSQEYNKLLLDRRPVLVKLLKEVILNKKKEGTNERWWETTNAEEKEKALEIVYRKANDFAKWAKTATPEEKRKALAQIYKTD